MGHRKPSPDRCRSRLWIYAVDETWFESTLANCPHLNKTSHLTTIVRGQNSKRAIITTFTRRVLSDKRWPEDVGNTLLIIIFCMLCVIIFVFGRGVASERGPFASHEL
jgi:hypothetical protein